MWPNKILKGTKNFSCIFSTGWVLCFIGSMNVRFQGRATARKVVVDPLSGLYIVSSRRSMREKVFG